MISESFNEILFDPIVERRVHRADSQKNEALLIYLVQRNI